MCLRYLFFIYLFAIFVLLRFLLTDYASINATDVFDGIFFRVNICSHFQEYPPGVTLVPMHSRTAKPFHTTNLVVFAPDNPSGYCGDTSFVASGDALIVDPGCHSDLRQEV